MSTANFRRLADTLADSGHAIDPDETLTNAITRVCDLVADQRKDLDLARSAVDMQREAVRNIGRQNDENARDARHYAKLAQDAHDALDEVGAPNLEAGTNTPAARIRALRVRSAWTDRVVSWAFGLATGALLVVWILS